ncbi:MAG TPA: DnaJ family domain-containing protein [Nevskiaceae bacterium]|nr:DnaJ family domain-containing protein [Nevskiaceae bacterium]
MAERQIEAAIARGEFDHLPGAGQRLRLDDDTLVPAGLRTAYRLLKNAGYLPAELDLHAQLHTAEDLLRAAHTDDERSHASRRLQLLRLQLAHTRAGAALLALDDYGTRIERRLSRPDAARCRTPPAQPEAQPWPIKP